MTIDDYYWILFIAFYLIHSILCRSFSVNLNFFFIFSYKIESQIHFSFYKLFELFFFSFLLRPKQSKKKRLERFWNLKSKNLKANSASLFIDCVLNNNPHHFKAIVGFFLHSFNFIQIRLKFFKEKPITDKKKCEIQENHKTNTVTMIIIIKSRTIESSLNSNWNEKKSFQAFIQFIHLFIHILYICVVLYPFWVFFWRILIPT